MAQLTATQKTQLNNMNAAAQRASLGTRLNTLQYGSVEEPSTGTVAPVAVVAYEMDSPYIGSATKCHAAITLTTGVQNITTGITNPDFARLLSAKGNDANVTGNVVITGTDINGDALTDTIALSGASEIAGTKAFKTVTNIQVPVYAVAGTETVSIGMGNKLGFPVAISNANLVIAKNFNGAVDAGTVTVGATAALSVYAPAGTLDGTKPVKLWFLSE